jgi:mannose/cellobiose epimerase-like protein (N-acyl-D-glucosamine 2-epimerase family)
MASEASPVALQSWLLNAALPLWAAYGVDRERGGFFERLNFDLTPIEELRRARLVARQIYCFATGHALGWGGAAKALVEHGLTFLTERLLTPGGTVIQAVSIDGSVTNTDYDPYDYAFIMLALAAAARELSDRRALHGLAQKVRDQLIAGWSHPLIGFTEPLPLKSNPHMHLLEAFLTWTELAGGEDPLWQDLAGQMINLCRTRLIIPQTGALTEFFDADWQPKPDGKGLLVVEPGHQFEWAGLLMRWAALKGDAQAFTLAWRLVEIAERHGIDANRKVVVNALNEHFEVVDAEAKLWPQTERIKALHTLTFHPAATKPQQAFARRKLPEAIAGLQAYFLRDPPGLWQETMREDGSFAPQPSRASSLYHITCAIATLAGASASPKRTL